jgi:F420-dependent oxidoreductase-like protein
MRIDIFGQPRTVDQAQTEAQMASDSGAGTYWLPQIESLSPLAALAGMAREVEDIRFGTAVVAVPTIHPVLLAQEALTLAQLSGGRFTLGIGLSHRPVVEEEWGLPWHPPLRYMTEYLDALLPLLEQRRVASEGSLVSVQTEIDVPAPPVPVLLAALGPRMLDLAGTRAGGTITWMVGPRTLAEHTAPRLRAAANGADRPNPRIVAGYVVCVTDDAPSARRRISREYEIYGELPSYRAMLDREGVAGPEDLALIGGADSVAERLGAITAAGATSIAVDIFGTRREREATWELVADLCA